MFSLHVSVVRHWGHLDLILGHKAPEEVWPRIVDWLSQRSA